MDELQEDVPDSRARANSGRRSGRVSTELWVRIGGNSRPIAKRRGDLAATGVFLLSNDPPGSPGDVVPITLMSADQSETFSTLARVARVLRQDDRARGSRVIGVAFEFLPLDRVQPDAVKLLRRVTTLAFSKLGQLRLDQPAPAFVRPTGGTRARARLRMFGAEQVTLHTASALPYRCNVEVELPNEPAPLSLTGEVISSTREFDIGAPRYTTIVHLDHNATERVPELLALAQQLLTPSAPEHEERSYYDFRGDLGTLPLTNVLELLRQERYSGVLSAGDARRFFSVEITDGEIGSIEPGGSTVGDLMGLCDGEFQFKNRRLAQLSVLTGSTARLMRDVFERKSPD